MEGGPKYQALPEHRPEHPGVAGNPQRPPPQNVLFRTWLQGTCSLDAATGLVQAGYPGPPGRLPWTPRPVTLDPQAGYPGPQAGYPEAGYPGAPGWLPWSPRPVTLRLVTLEP